MSAITPFCFQSHKSMSLRAETLRMCARAVSMRRSERLSQ